MQQEQTRMPQEQSDARKKLMTLCRQYEFSREERLELACYLLRRDITSYTQLDEDQVRRLLDAFEGHHLIETLLRMRY
jgi:hypothetical protein